jgi:hypothetical protein
MFWPSVPSRSRSIVPPLSGSRAFVKFKRQSRLVPPEALGLSVVTQ